VCLIHSFQLCAGRNPSSTHAAVSTSRLPLRLRLSTLLRGGSFSPHFSPVQGTAAIKRVERELLLKVVSDFISQLVATDDEAKAALVAREAEHAARAAELEEVRVVGGEREKEQTHLTLRKAMQVWGIYGASSQP
jgi:hypothetical protein